MKPGRWLRLLALTLLVLAAGRMVLRYLDYEASEAARADPGDPPPAAALPDLDAHVHGFAMAYCLRSLGDKGLPEPEAQVMRQQGDRWSQIVVEQSRGDFTRFFVIMPALDAALAATPMALVKVEDTGGSAAAPLFYCDKLLRQPAVVQAMAAARASLAPDYAGD